MLRRVTHALARTDTADRLRGLALRIVGLSALVQAGFTVSDTLGWTAVGAAVFVLEWSLEDDDEIPTT